MVRESFPRPKVPGAISIISAIFGVGSGIALPLSGIIVDHLDTSWLFWLGLVAVPVAIAAHFWVPGSRSSGDSIDWAGALVLAAALTSMLLGVTQAPTLGWGSPANVGLLAGGVMLLALWLWIESRIAQPLIRLDVLIQRTVATTNLTTFTIGLAMFSGFLLILQLAQAPAGGGPGLGTTATIAGLLLLPSAIGQLLVGTFAGRLGVALGFRNTLVLGARTHQRLVRATGSGTLPALAPDARRFHPRGWSLLCFWLDGQPHRSIRQTERRRSGHRLQHRGAHGRRRLRLRHR